MTVREKKDRDQPVTNLAGPAANQARCVTRREGCNLRAKSASHYRKRTLLDRENVARDYATGAADSKTAELIKRVCDGKHDAVEELFRPYQRFVYASST